jgi:Lysophospholipase L1 and related esterases
MFEGGREKSLKFSEYYAVQASQINCYFLDSSTVIESSQIDGIHFEKGEHVKLGKAVAEKVKEILS